MRIALTILFYSLCQSLFATTYYVSNTGNDANDGTSQATAWQTVAKINSSSFLPGDQILFKRGDTWTEQLKITSSGTQANPIYIGSYGTGNRPLITGFQSLSGFTNVGNIWTAVATNATNNLHIILINGKTYPLARYPNAGAVLTYSSFSGDSSITGTLTGTPSYVGKQIVVRSAEWLLNTSVVTQQVAGKLTFSPKFPHPIASGVNGYFFQNDSSFLDLNNEWTFDSVSKRISIYQTSSPTVQYSTIDTLIWLSKGDWIAFDGINFTGGNQKIFQIDSCRGVTIQNCYLNYAGYTGISALKSNLLTIDNDSIQNCYSNGVFARNLSLVIPVVNQCDSATFTNNYVKRIGIYPGMGLTGETQYDGVVILGDNKGPLIQGNRFDSVGYIPIHAFGRYSNIRNNVVSNFCFVKDDGAGIYMGITGVPDGFNDSSLITSNIIYNAIGAPLGSTQAQPQSHGIYADDNSTYLTIDSNTVYNSGAAVFFHNCEKITFRSNNSYNNYWGMLFSNARDSFVISNNSFYSNTGNILLNAALQSLVWPTTVGTIDSNYYANPWDDSQSFNVNATHYYNLSGWQTLSGKDLHSQNVPSGVNKWPVKFLVNSLSIPQTFRILGTYIAVNGTSYNNYVTLQPYQSITLIKATVNDGTAYPPSSLPLFITKITQL